VNANVTDILWKFNLSSATMNTGISYTIDGKKIDGIDTRYKNMTGGNEKKNLLHRFKIANFSLLKELEK
jgi:hypothetical protein